MLVVKLGQDGGAKIIARHPASHFSINVGLWVAASCDMLLAPIGAALAAMSLGTPSSVR